MSKYCQRNMRLIKYSFDEKCHKQNRVFNRRFKDYFLYHTYANILYFIGINKWAIWHLFFPSDVIRVRCWICQTTVQNLLAIFANFFKDNLCKGYVTVKSLYTVPLCSLYPDRVPQYTGHLLSPQNFSQLARFVQEMWRDFTVNILYGVCSYANLLVSSISTSTLPITSSFTGFFIIPESPKSNTQ